MVIFCKMKKDSLGPHQHCDSFDCTQVPSLFFHLHCVVPIQVYELGCKYFDAEPSEILFVSSNGWDAAAAGLFGFHTIWANRSGAPVERLPKAPDHIASDLSYVTTHLSTLAR